MKNPISHIVQILFTDYSLPSGLLLGLHVIFLLVDKGAERREEKKSDPWSPARKAETGRSPPEKNMVYIKDHLAKN